MVRAVTCVRYRDGSTGLTKAFPDPVFRQFVEYTTANKHSRHTRANMVQKSLK